MRKNTWNISIKRFFLILLITKKSPFIQFTTQFQLNLLLVYLFRHKTIYLHHYRGWVLWENKFHFSLLLVACSVALVSDNTHKIGDDEMFDVEYFHTTFKTITMNFAPNIIHRHINKQSVRENPVKSYYIFFTLISPPLIIIKWLGKIKILISEVIIWF